MDCLGPKVTALVQLWVWKGFRWRCPVLFAPNCVAPTFEISHMGVSQNYGYPFGGPYNKDYSILGSILGSPYLGKLPYGDLQPT